MKNRRSWFAIGVAVAVAAMFIIPGLAFGDKGGGTPNPPPENPPCDANHGHPAEHAKKCRDGGTDGTTTDGTTTDGTTTDGTTTGGTTTDGTTTDGTTTDGTTTTGVANACEDTIALPDETAPFLRLHLEPGGGDTHGTGIAGLVHACVTLGIPPAPLPVAPCPATEGDAVIIPDVLELRTDGSSYITACAHI